MVIVQRWDSKSDYENYLAWRKKTGVFSEFEGFFDGAVSIRYFEQLDV